MKAKQLHLLVVFMILSLLSIGPTPVIQVEAVSMTQPIPDFYLNSYKPGSDTGNIVLQLGGAGAWDDEKILHPSTVNQGGTVYLFYAGWGGDVDGSGNSIHWQIGVATEATAGFTGLNFSKSGSNPILTYGGGGAWDEEGVMQPFVIYDSDASLWKMWYVGIDTSYNMKIGYATASSPTGPWTKHGSNPVLSTGVAWEGTKVILPVVLREDATTYKMLYAGNEPSSNDGRIGLATSSDGVTWTKYASNPVLAPTGGSWDVASVFSPRTLVKGNDGVYHLYYSAKDGLTPFVHWSRSGYAHSLDLISWTVPAINPLLTADRAWEAAGAVSGDGETENANFFEVGDNQYIFYDAFFGDPATIGVVIVPTRTIPKVYSNQFGSTTPGTHEQLFGDRSAFNVADYGTRHASDWDAGDSHHAEVTLAADAEELLGLSGQQITLDSQAANTVFAGPASGADADPTFRTLVAADIPAGAGDQVKVSSNDTTAGYLNGKLVAGDRVTLTENNDGGNETLAVRVNSHFELLQDEDGNPIWDENLEYLYTEVNDA